MKKQPLFCFSSSSRSIAGKFRETKRHMYERKFTALIIIGS